MLRLNTRSERSRLDDVAKTYMRPLNRICVIIGCPSVKFLSKKRQILMRVCRNPAHVDVIGRDEIGDGCVVGEIGERSCALRTA